MPPPPGGMPPPPGGGPLDFAFPKSAPMSAPDTREMCGDFKRGDCSRGDRCRFSHGDGQGGKGQGKDFGKGKDDGKGKADGKGKEGKDKGGKKGKVEDWICQNAKCGE